jgi:hypothetical protein
VVYLKWSIPALLLLCSCSGTQRIASDATQIGELANSSRERFVDIQSAASELVDTDRIRNQASEGEAEQIEILSVVSSIHQTLPTVEDKVPWWADLISKVMIGLSILGVCFLLWYTGLGYLLKKFFWSLGMFLPSKAKRDAKFAVDVLDDSKPESSREAVAARRSCDPAFDKAFEIERRKRSGK